MHGNRKKLLYYAHAVQQFLRTNPQRKLFMSRKPFTSSLLKTEAQRILILLLAAFVYSIGINWFIVPAGLYTGGLLGLSQLFRSFLVNFFHLNFSSIDIAGLIYYAINVPFLFLAHRLMGKLYFAKSILCITAESLFLVIIPVPAEALVPDMLAASLIGGAIAGSMMGLMLRMGACDGGMDLIGVLIVHQKKGASIGNANLYVNIVVFTIMAFNYPLPVLIYSLIAAMVTAYALDHFFTQNINVEFHIILQKKTEELEHRIQKELRRTLTRWHSVGAYSGEESHVLYVIVDKYEAPRLRRLIREYDPTAFVVENTGVTVNGNFEKHLD